MSYCGDYPSANDEFSFMAKMMLLLGITPSSLRPIDAFKQLWSAMINPSLWFEEYLRSSRSEISA